MATGGQKEIGYNLVNDGTLTLAPGLRPNGIVVSGDMLMVTNDNGWNVHLYKLHDGKLLATSDKLESWPNGICFVNDREICVALGNGTVEFMSVGDKNVITSGRKLNLNTAIDECHGVARFMDKVVVCGVKQGTICWCIVSLHDGHIDKVRKICKGNESHMTTKASMIYISCYADSPDTGIYGYDILNPSQEPFTYKHEDLNIPNGITVDNNGFLFVCDSTECIHHLTNKCELVTMYREGIPGEAWDILWNNGILYVTRFENNMITRYKPEYPHQQGQLHRNVLNLCLPALVKNLKFKAASLYIYQKELFDDVTMRDITKQRTTPDKTRELIKQIQQRDQDTYEKFKECLVQAKQAFLKVMLEKEEAKFSTEIKIKNDAVPESTTTAQKTAAPTTKTPTAPVRTVQAPVTKQPTATEASTTNAHKSRKQLDVGGAAVQKQLKVPETKKGTSTTKPKPDLPTQQPRSTHIQPSVHSKPVKPKTKLQAASPADKKVSMGDSKREPTTKSKKDISLKALASRKGHVMISYNWGEQEKALWIKGQLETNGYTVWMDVQDMGPELLESMAEAVQKAHVILVCMTRKYKESINCKREATYAAEQKKKMIPLVMEKNFKKDGWLGILTAGFMYYDFSGNYPLEEKMKELLAEIAKCYGKKFKEPRIVPFSRKDGEPQPECIPYQCPLTVEYIQVKFIDSHRVRQKHFDVNPKNKLYDEVPPKEILYFTKECSLYDKF